MANTTTLANLTHSYTTDLAKGTINNADAALLIINAYSGVASRGEVIAILKSWRPGRHYSYLFNSSRHGGYGFVAGDINQTHNDVYHSPSWDQRRNVSVEGHTSQRRTYYYRKGPGLYALTNEGIKRLAELGIKTP